MQIPSRSLCFSELKAQVPSTGSVLLETKGTNPVYSAPKLIRGYYIPCFKGLLSGFYRGSIRGYSNPLRGFFKGLHQKI